MTRFQETGVERQETAMTVKAAVRAFERSCDLCCCRGYQTPCDQCPIAVAHENRVEILKLARKVKCNERA